MPRPNALAVSYEDLIGKQEQAVAAAVRFITGDPGIDAMALARALAQAPVGGVRDPTQHAHYDPALFARLERQVADACGKDRIRSLFI